MVSLPAAEGAPEVQVSPEQLALGASCTGTQSADVVIENVGDAPLTVQDLRVEGGAWTLDAPPALPLTLAVALPKGDRQKWLVEKLTELGCARLVPLVTTRGVAEATPAAIERLGRAAIEACKQCGRTMLLEIAPPATLAAVLAARDPGALALVADPAGEALGPLLAGHAGAVLALVGPEGGFTAEELAAAEAAGWRRVSLAPHILRVETAAIALAAVMAAYAVFSKPSPEGH
jgi:RsmE family RNA methyltransferase